MRIIAGSLKGGALFAPKGLTLRPTSDKVREALFDILRNSIEGASFLDLFAGVGAVGIEALSRGARCVIFVEKDPRHRQYIKKNLQRYHLMHRARVYNLDALAFLRNPPKDIRRYDLIFLDPPYGSAILKKALPMVASSDMINVCNLVIVEHHHKLTLEEKIADLQFVRKRCYGDTALSFYAKAE